MGEVADEENRWLPRKELGMHQLARCTGTAESSEQVLREMSPEANVGVCLVNRSMIGMTELWHYYEAITKAFWSWTPASVLERASVSQKEWL